ncbi:hypothetical protein [Caballeronia hypogeia]|uniref:hypothetical protein n=1 Tax=Caballeronia hypogeia TaxID=1777140 RepID=UPI000772A2B0|nr:hypothetical protein [Caballeronia hypogeia]
MNSPATSSSRISRNPWKIRYFLDTEFTDFDVRQLISIAIVGEDRREFYAECSDFDRVHCSDFVRATVLPQLGHPPGRSMPFLQLRDELRAWLRACPSKPKPILCYDFEGDLELIQRLLDGTLPSGWKTENITLKIDAVRLADYAAAHGGTHLLRCINSATHVC